MRDFLESGHMANQLAPISQGVKNVKQMRATSAPTIHNCRKTKKIANTYDYFLEEVDPLVGACIAHLLVVQPEDILKEMLIYFRARQKGELPPVQPHAGKPKREQKLYLATSIGPIVAKLINRIAVSRPRAVLEFMCSEIESMMEFSGADDVPSIPVHSQDMDGKKASSARNRLNAARVMADTVSAPMPNSVSASRENASKPRNKLDQAKALAETLVSDVIATCGSPVKPAPAPVKRSMTIQIALLGLGGGGKTSIMNALQGDFNAKVRPSIGFKPTAMMMGENVNVRFYDLGGGPRIRDIWDQYYHDVHAVIYVVDAASTVEGIEEAARIFHTTVNHPYLSAKPLLIFANQQDKEGAISAESIADIIDFKNLHSGSCPVKVVPSTALAVGGGDGEAEAEGAAGSGQLDPRIERGLEWLLEQIEEQYDLLNDRVVLDSKQKEAQEAKKRMERERKVLKKKIASAFSSEVDPELMNGEVPNPEDLYSEEEGVAFIASEIGEEVVALPPNALEVVALVGYQRLAMQMIGALKAPISKKKVAMSWDEILELVRELRVELGLSPSL